MNLSRKQRAFIRNNALLFRGSVKADPEFADYVIGLNAEQKEMLGEFIDNLSVQQASVLIKNLIEKRFLLVQAVFEQALKNNL